MPTGKWARTKKHKKILKENLKKAWKKRRYNFLKYGISKETRRKMSEAQKRIGNKPPQNQHKYSNEKNRLWVGEKVSYSALHAWITRKLGKPRKCEHCGTTTAKKYEWANKDHKYRRNVNDYMRLCTRCHRLYDKENNRNKRRLVYSNNIRIC